MLAVPDMQDTKYAVWNKCRWSLHYTKVNTVLKIVRTMTHRKYVQPTQFQCFNHYTMASSFVHIHATCPSHLILIDLITQKFGTEHKS